MSKLGEILKKLHISKEVTLAQAELDELKDQFEAYLQSGFNDELVAINSYEALKDFSKKLSELGKDFLSVDIEIYKARIIARQESLLHPSHWQELAEDSDIWPLLRQWYSLPDQGRGKVAFMQAYQTWLSGEITDEIRDLLFYIATGNVEKVKNILVDTKVCATLNKLPHPLLLSARNGNAVIFNSLLAKGADINFRNSEGKDCLALALNSNNTQMIQVVYEAKINRYVLSEQDIQEILQWAYPQQNKEIIEFFLKFINEKKDTFPLLVKVLDHAAMQNDSKIIATLAAKIHQRLQMLSLNGYQYGLSAEPTMEMLRQFTPRQLARLRRANHSINQLINDSHFINSLVRSYGLRDEYDAECAKPDVVLWSNFAKFYEVYLRTWVKPDVPVFKKNFITEELVHAMVLRQGDKVKAILATESHGFIQSRAFPLRWAARVGRIECVLLLLGYNARIMPQQTKQLGVLKCDLSKTAFLEAVRGNHRDCAEILFNGMTSEPLTVLRAAVKITIKKGYLVLMKQLLDNCKCKSQIIDEAIMLAAKHGKNVIFNELIANYCDPDVIEHTTLVFSLFEAVKKNNVIMASAILKKIQFEDRNLYRYALSGRYDKFIRLIISLTMLFNRNANISQEQLFAVRYDSKYIAAINENNLSAALRQNFSILISESLGSAWVWALRGENCEIARLAKEKPQRVLFTQALFGFVELPTTAVLIANITSQPWLERNLPELFSTHGRKENFKESLTAIFEECLWNLIISPEIKNKLQLKEPEGVFLLKICLALLQDSENEVNSLFGKSIANSEKIPLRNKLLLNDVLKTVVKQLLAENEDDLEVAVEIYLLVACMLDDRFTVEQKFTVVQAYQQTSKHLWQQTLAKSLIDKIKGKIEASSEVLTGTAELLAAQGLFKTPEQHLDETVITKQDAPIESKKPYMS